MVTVPSCLFGHWLVLSFTLLFSDAIVVILFCLLDTSCAKEPTLLYVDIFYFALLKKFNYFIQK